MLLLCLSFLLLGGQDPPRVTKAQKKQREHVQVVDTTTKAVRRVDSLYLEQRVMNMKLDSLVEVQKKKL